jgi:Tfp pilus assembly ATPase PilU
LLDEHLFSLFRQEKISEEDAVDRSQNPGEVQEKIDMLKSGKLSTVEKTAFELAIESQQQQEEEAVRK